MMKDRIGIAVCVALLLSCLHFVAQVNAQPSPAAGKKPSVKLIYGALTAANGPIWLAADQGLFEKHGLDVQIVHGRGATPVQATISGAVEFMAFVLILFVGAEAVEHWLLRWRYRGASLSKG